MFILEQIKDNSILSDSYIYKESSFADKIDLINEIRTSTKEGLGRLKTYIKFLLQNGLKVNMSRQALNSLLNSLKDNSELRRKAIAILGFDKEKLDEYGINPFKAVRIDMKGNKVIAHYDNNIFLKGALGGEDIWTPAMKEARGIIYKISDIPIKGRSGKISMKARPKMIARSFEKFFNIGEVGIKDANLENIKKLASKYRFTISEKWDGANGIIYLNGNRPDITTKGSLTSIGSKTHKNLFQKIMNNKLNKGKLLQKLREGYIFIVEIINNLTSVHIKYKTDDLVLIGVNKLNPETGELEKQLTDYEVTKMAKDLNFSRTLPITGKGLKDFEKWYKKTQTEKFNDESDIKEGYVVTFYDKTGDIVNRIKMKYMAYIELMKKQNLNWDKIFNMLVANKGLSLENFERFIKSFGQFEELFPTLGKMINILLNTYDKSKGKEDFIKNMMKAMKKFEGSGYSSFFLQRKEKKGEEKMKSNLMKIIKSYNKLERFKKEGLNPKEEVLKVIPDIIARRYNETK